MSSIKCPESLPNPIFEHLATLHLKPPTKPHPSSFFDPPSAIDPPSRLGPVVDQAKSFIHSILPPWAENHCYRTYAYGVALAEAAGWSTHGPDALRLGWDKELWFLTAILHDIGWDVHASHQSRLSFELFGRVKARELLTKWGASQEEADEVCEAIVRHTESANTGGIRLMGALAQTGALQDLIGILTPAYIHSGDVELVCKRWPRLGLLDHVEDFAGKELACKPGCLTSLWVPRFAATMKESKGFDGPEGEVQDDGGWTGRRKDIDY